jgi:MarR family transcriptional regulator, transcriptional regulator for hemolysin
MESNQTQLLHSLNQFSRHFSKALNEALIPLGLYSAQWTIIYLIKTNGSSTQKTLAQYLGVEAPTMTRTIARLEKSGWITKLIGADKREKQIVLTEAAMNKYEEWHQAVRACESRVLKTIEDEEIHSMLLFIEKMKENL